jgi:hypothetical protein
MRELSEQYWRIAPRHPGLALVAEPDGREDLWVLNLWATPPVLCICCGAATVRHYRPAAAFGRGSAGSRLCRSCVEGELASPEILRTVILADDDEQCHK